MKNAEKGWMRNSLLFQQSEKRRQDINDLKWYESEKAGRDIGWDCAVARWTIWRGLASHQNLLGH